MAELVKIVLEIISSLPDPANLANIIDKVQESNSTIEFDVARKLLIMDFLNKQPENKGVFIDHEVLRSLSSCPECGVNINNGYFKVILASHSGSVNSGSIQVEQKVVISYEALHNLINHKISNKYVVATNESFAELQQQNLDKNPRDQLSQQNLKNLIENYNLKKLNTKLSEMMTH
ncbi:MAG: hypothetical protein ACXAC6_15930 [Candidatus Hodarchaeales archaeon]